MRLFISCGLLFICTLMTAQPAQPAVITWDYSTRSGWGDADMNDGQHGVWNYMYTTSNNANHTAFTNLGYWENNSWKIYEGARPSGLPERNDWYTGLQFLLLHPGQNYDVIISFTAPFEGTYSLSLQALSYNNGETANGQYFYIQKNSDILDSAYNANLDSKTFNLSSIDLMPGDSLFFRVNANGTQENSNYFDGISIISFVITADIGDEPVIIPEPLTIISLLIGCFSIFIGKLRK